MMMMMMMMAYKRVSVACSHFVDTNSFLNLFVEFPLFVIQYSRITFINNGESENSNEKQKVFKFVGFSLLLREHGRDLTMYVLRLGLALQSV